MKLHLGKPPLSLVQFAQPSQADAGDAVVVVEHVEDVVHAHQVGAGEDGGATEGQGS